MKIQTNAAYRLYAADITVEELGGPDAKTLIKKKGVKIEYGDWTKEGKKFKSTHGTELTFHSITVYKNQGRLRVPEKTKYEVYAEFYTTDSQRLSITFGKSVGETAKSSEVVDEAKKKAINWAKSVCDIQITNYDFLR
jgi:hypothetical protein